MVCHQLPRDLGPFPWSSPLGVPLLGTTPQPSPGQAQLESCPHRGWSWKIFIPAFGGRKALMAARTASAIQTLPGCPSTRLEAPLPPAAWGPASSRPTHRTGRRRSWAEPLPWAPVFLFPNGNPNNSPSPVGEATVWEVLTFHKQGVHRHLGTKEKTQLSVQIQGCSQRS